MPPRCQVVDILCRCLGPSFSSTSRSTHLGRAVQSAVHLNSEPWRPRISTRQQSSIAAAGRRVASKYAKETAPPPGRARTRQAVAEREGKRQAGRPQLHEISDEQLHKQLRQVASFGKFEETYSRINQLVEHRGEEPALMHYEALILANCDVEHGSAAEVERLLDELEKSGLNADQSVYEAALKALAIHPSYLLRTDVLSRMSSSWIKPSPKAWHYVACGLLRDRQVERAVNCMQQMYDKGVPIQDWLYEVFIMTLADIDELDVMLTILRGRVSGSPQALSAVLWTHALAAGTRNLHYPTVKYVWHQQISTGHINPSSGLCSAILDTFARAGDHQLATDVFRILGNRSTSLTSYQYEALLESFLQPPHPDLRRALSIISIMGSGADKAIVTDASLRALYLHLQNDSALPGELLKLLHAQRQAGGFSNSDGSLAPPSVIPLPVLHVVLEGAVHHKDMTLAMRAYRDLAVLCSPATFPRTKSGSKSTSNPDLERATTPIATTRTFNIILRGCSGTRRKDIAMFLASEMIALGVRPDELTYDRLMLACMEAELAASTGSQGDPAPEVKRKVMASNPGEDSMEDAWRYFAEMQRLGMWPRKGTLIQLCKMACERGDDRVWDLIDSMEEQGMETVGLKKWCGTRWNDQGR